MAAFFLARKGSGIDIDAAKRVFAKRSLGALNVFEVGGFELLLYKKRLVDTENFFQTEQGRVFAVGTFAYKGNSYAESLKIALEDFLSGSLDTDEFSGNFVLIFYINGALTLLCDAMNMTHIFSDRERSFMTTSFLAAAAVKKHSVNKTAVYEKLLYGYLTAPDTLSNEIVRLCRKEKRFDGVEFVKNDYKYSPRTSSASREEMVREQCTQIENYFESVKALCTEYGAEQGLSGGYDSRLIYAAACKALGNLTSAHTHNTKDVHNREMALAENIAKVHDTALRKIPTKYITDYEPQEIDEILRTNVYYFDGRNSENIGVFSATHTPWYKEQTTGDARLTFSGVGGEIYRNFYHTSAKTINFKKWLKAHVYTIRAPYLFDKETFETIQSSIIAKMENEFGIKLSGRTDRFAAKLYFAQNRIPNALACVASANNTQSFYLAPFTESALVDKAYDMYRFAGLYGEFEGEMIKTLDAEVIKCPSSYGYDMTRMPLMQKIKWGLRSILPSDVYIYKAAHDKANEKEVRKLQKLLAKSAYFSKAYEYFKNEFPNINTAYFEAGNVEINNTVFTVCTLYEMSTNFQG
ncbi:MAG: hypothetical protein Q4C12_04460 [Clostridia bacterium]|nr:hypothetical protein [Clostridia bacterium]